MAAHTTVIRSGKSGGVCYRIFGAVADRSGSEIWKVYEDAGISGAKGRDKRPGLDAMLKAVQFDLVARGRWTGLDDRLLICSASSRSYGTKVLIVFFISRALIRQPPQARRCFRCRVYLPSSSEGPRCPTCLWSRTRWCCACDTVEDAGFCGDNSTTCVEGF
jgi:hypothetical protein